MSDIYVRIDARVEDPNLWEILLRLLRGLEQKAPDKLHLAITYEDGSHSYVEHVRTLSKLMPGFQIRVLEDKDMTEEERIAKVQLLGLVKQN